MKFDSAARVEEVCWQMQLADINRGCNRAAIDRLANGNPPYTEQEALQMNAETNVNFLEFPEYLADARRSYYNSFLKPGNFFKVSVDLPDAMAAQQAGDIITSRINRLMNRSLPYFEYRRSQGAQVVLHGIGPGFWRDRDRWCPQSIGLADTLIPSDTRLDMDNLMYFAVFRQFTPLELKKATTGPKVDPGWKMDTVKAALSWAQEQVFKTYQSNDTYSPEKVEDWWKQDGGFFGSDAVPTIDAWDFYFWDDSADQCGWRRRMILNTPTPFELGPDGRRIASKSKPELPNKNGIGQDRGHWLYNPGERVYAANRSEIIHFQFADCSAVAPFKYHSVRSLGWLLYAVCHLQNRLRCKLTDAAFENLMNLFRVNNADDHERVTKVDLHNFGVVPEGIAFVGQQERWQPNAPFVELVANQNDQRMRAAASQYREGRDTSPSSKEKTATEIMAEVNSANALVGSMLAQSEKYATFEYQEIARRFCEKNSVDPDVRAFRNDVLKKVPEEALNYECWTVEPERVMGAGNKTLEIAQVDKLMAARGLHDPDAQREILYIYDRAVTDNPELSARLASPAKKGTSQSTHDAQLMFASLMLGVQMAPVKGQNPMEIAEALLGGIAAVVNRVTKTGQPITPAEVAGLNNVAMTAEAYIQQLAGDEQQKDRVRQYTSLLGSLMQKVKQLGAESAKAQPVNGGMDPKDQAKIQATLEMGRAKIALAQESHAQRTTGRDVQERMRLAQQGEKHVADMAAQSQRNNLELVKTAQQLRMERNKPKAKE